MTSATLVIPTRGGAQRLPVLFKALEQQTHDDWDAIVVIDGDIDSSERVVREYQHLPIRTIVLPENRGRVTALNTGFSAAQGDILIRCDDDFEPGPNHIAAHVAEHERHTCGVVGLPLNLAPESAYMRSYGRDADQRGRRDAYALPAEDRWQVWGGNSSVRKETYEQVGGFDAAYRGYGWEDLDFGYRLHRLGVPIVVLPELEVRHHMASVNTRVRTSRAFRSGMARHTFVTRNSIFEEGDSDGDIATLWSRLVSLVAAAMTEQTSHWLAAFVDAALPMLPRPMGRKLVALTVEAAALAGYRHERTTA